ncbi:uncharacterized protein LOC128883841 [Hylaeus volcanicus]|uniref:uncharacterized protein LOC128883841 n=1 Tax=Hylaeus volcanicus TaxID=313075 RepID=UPI0023B85E8C|nr:uncharacterized protein LOC128883841 [Hylaeus volcanicus]
MSMVDMIFEEESSHCFNFLDMFYYYASNHLYDLFRLLLESSLMLLPISLSNKTAVLRWYETQELPIALPYAFCLLFFSAIINISLRISAPIYVDLLILFILLLLWSLTKVYYDLLLKRQKAFGCSINSREKYDSSFYAENKKKLRTASHMMHVIRPLQNENSFKSDHVLVHFKNHTNSREGNFHTCANENKIITPVACSKKLSLNFVLETLIHPFIPFRNTRMFHTLTSSDIQYWNHNIHKKLANISHLSYEKQRVVEVHFFKTAKNCISKLDEYYNLQNHSFSRFHFKKTDVLRKSFILYHAIHKKLLLPQLFGRVIKNNFTKKHHTRNIYKTTKNNIMCITTNAAQSALQCYSPFSQDNIIWITSYSNKLKCSPYSTQNIYLFLFLTKFINSIKTSKQQYNNDWLSPKRPFLTHSPVENISLSLQHIFTYFFHTVSYYKDCTQITLLYKSKTFNFSFNVNKCFRNYCFFFFKRLLQLSMELDEKHTTCEIFCHCFPVYLKDDVPLCIQCVTTLYHSSVRNAFLDFLLKNFTIAMGETLTKHNNSFMYPVLSCFSLEMYMQIFKKSLIDYGNVCTSNLFVFLKEKLPSCEDLLTLSFFKECSKITNDFVLQCSHLVNLKCIPKKLLTEELNFQVKEALKTNSLLRLNKAFDVIHFFNIKVNEELCSQIVDRSQNLNYQPVRSSLLKFVQEQDYFKNIQNVSRSIAVFLKYKDQEILKNLLKMTNTSKEVLSISVMANFIKACNYCGHVEYGLKLWFTMIENCIQPTPYIFGCLLDMLVSNNHVIEAFIFLQNSTEYNINPNTVHYSIVLKGCAQKKMLTKALEVYKDMKDKNIFCNNITYNTLINTCIVCNNPTAAACIVSDMWLRNKLKPDVVTYSTIIKGFCEKKKLRDAMNIFFLMLSHDVEPDAITYNTLLEAYSHEESPILMDLIFNCMLQRNVAPSPFTLTIMIKYLGKQGQLARALTLADELPYRFQFQKDSYVYTALIAACITCNDIPKALQFFIELNKSPYKKVVTARTFRTICFGCLKAKNVLAAYVFAYEATDRQLNIDQNLLHDIFIALKGLNHPNHPQFHYISSSLVSPTFLRNAIAWLKRYVPCPPRFNFPTLQKIFSQFRLPSNELHYLFSFF